MKFSRLFPSIACALLILFSLSRAASGQASDASGRQSFPNILWITSEDNAAQWLGCYGNEDALTPRLDAMAKDSVLFKHAFSNAPVCAVARSTILHGIYAVSSGTQHMRSRHAIPASFKPYVSYLQELGYYCTNKTKTDYNRLGNDKSIWDACDRHAHYKNRKENQPFFAIFNLTVSHESSLFPQKVATNRKRGIIAKQTRLSPDALQLPPYLPDLPEIRSDFAIYHDTMTALDKQIGGLLDELAELGLADDTVVFYYGDHGGPTPRGKRYLTNTGVHIPMMVHVPKKWQHLSPFQSADQVDELVAFVDLAPTLLSLCGQPKPTQMQGRAFLGTHRVEPEENPMVFLFADRFDGIQGMRRGLTNGRFKYIRRFTPHLPAAPCSKYSLSMPGWIAWQQAWRDGKLQPEYNKLWEAPQSVEELYDLSADPWEVNNLANDPAQTARLTEFRKRLQAEMTSVQDTGVIPEGLFKSLAGDQTICDYVRSDAAELTSVLDAAFLASASDPGNLPSLSDLLKNEHPAIRYWGALGCAILGESAASLEPQLSKLLDDSEATVRMTAALALARIGKQEAGQAAVLKELDSSLNPEEGIQLTNLIPYLGCDDDVPQAWIDSKLNDKRTNEYVLRYARDADKQRKQ